MLNASLCNLYLRHNQSQGISDYCDEFLYIQKPYEHITTILEFVLLPMHISANG